jgi:hypothetical protein
MGEWVNKNRQTLVRTLGSVLAIALLVVLLRENGGDEIISALHSISIGYFFAAVAALFISRLFVVARWHVLLRSADVQIPFPRTMMLTFTGLFSSNFLPTTIGGDVVRLGGAMQLGFDRAICLASLVADRVVGMLGMTLTLPFGLVPAFSPGGIFQSVTFAALYEQVVGFAKRTMDAFRIWLKKPRALMLSFLATFVSMAFIFLSVYLLIEGMDRHVPYWMIAGVWTLTYFVTQVPVSINGLGVQELSMTFLFVELGGLGHSESVIVAILVRLLFVIASLPGAFFLPSILAAMNEEQVNSLR